MTFANWIDLKLSEINKSLLYGKYFDSIVLENFVDEYSLFNSPLGIDLIMREDLSIKAIHFYSGKSSGVEQFKGELPFDLNFSNSREFARKIFGKPLSSGGGDSEVVGLYSKTPFWDRYTFGNYILHLQFTEDLEGIELITLYSSREVI
jgi:hypothetical protein